MSIGRNFGSMVLSTASGYHRDDMLYVKLLQSSITEDSGSSYLFKATVASAAVGSVDTGSVSTVGKHSVVYNDLSLACGNINLYDIVQDDCAVLATGGDSKPHSVDVVVCTVCQSEAHESAECPTHNQFANELNRIKDISPGAHIKVLD